MSLRELEKLSKGERLLIQRRRRKQSQSEAAKRLGVSYSRYSQWERDLFMEGSPSVKVEPLKAHECCLLYRRRAKFTQERVAKDMGVCRWWLNQMERGAAPCDELIGYWEC
jgi:transcriptional regulator with XRE-family HTH domain